MKECFKCGNVKPLSDFYRHSRMADGRLGKCKECAKTDVKENYAARRTQYSRYEKSRQGTIVRRLSKLDYMRKHRALYSERYAARTAVSNAIRDGRLMRQPCSVCGNRAQAHHKNYSNPLDVDWLCFRHHRELRHGQIVSSN